MHRTGHLNKININHNGTIQQKNHVTGMAYYGASLSEPYTALTSFRENLSVQCRVRSGPPHNRPYYAPYVRLTVPIFPFAEWTRWPPFACHLPSLRTASNEKEIVRHEADTPTSHPGKDTGIGRRNSALSEVASQQITPLYNAHRNTTKNTQQHNRF